MNRFLRYVRHSGHLLPAALTGYLWFKGQWPHLPGLGCPFRALTGIPCPGCFLTRATAAALTGQWSESIELHAFGPLTAALIVAWSIQSLRTKRLFPKNVSLAWIPIGASALFSYWLLRVILTYVYPSHGILAFPTV